MRTFIFCLATAVAVTGLAVDSARAESSNENRAQHIASDLKQSGRLKDYRVGVKYEDGVAWLTGTVTDPRQRKIAEEVARRSPGVAHVVNKLEVENSGSDFETVESGTYEDQELEVASNEQDNFQQPPRIASRRQPMAPRLRSQNTRSPRRLAARAPKSNMPVPYASARGQGVRPAGYSRQAQYAGGGMQGGMRPPSPMGGGAPPAVGQAASYDNPQMPGYAWPSYAASSNYAALTYPKQYSPSAWPYIGPFYPYPQVPLGWRKVTLEWDDGWWFLDFKDK